jgi:hypothetical protein
MSLGFVGVLAHGLIQRADLPIPEWLFGWAAAIVLVVSFVALAVLWPRPKLENGDGWRALPSGPARIGAPAVDTVCQTLGLLLFGFLIYAGFAGTDDADANIFPTFVFVIFWVGLVFTSIAFGNVYNAFNPWRALGRLLHLRGVRPYPERLGRWPAALGLLCFTWLELCSGGAGEYPHKLAIAALVYTAAMLLGSALYGVEAWTARGDAFAVYFGLFARIAPFEVRHGRLGLRYPLTALTRLDTQPGTVAVIATMIGTVSFDGLSSGQWWTRASQNIEANLIDHMSLSLAERLTATGGLLVCVSLVAGFFWLGVAGAARIRPQRPAADLARTFVHTLLPIAVVYVAAHYLTFLVFSGQSMRFLISDPLGHGWDLFGTAKDGIDYGLLSQNATWYLQVGVVVAGHVAALALAHDRALVAYTDARAAVRSQYWMLGVMVGFTTLALWLLAKAGA